MNFVFYIIGKSGSGKDTIVDNLINDKKYSSLNLLKIVPFTTRPMRKNEVNGDSYYFIKDQSEILKYSKNGVLYNIIEKRDYHVANGKTWSYFTADCIDTNKSNNYITIGTLESFHSVSDYYNRKNKFNPGKSVAVFPIYIMVDYALRLDRMYRRELEKHDPDFKEVIRRFLQDEKDFVALDNNNDNIEWPLQIDNNGNINDTCDILYETILSIMKKAKILWSLNRDDRSRQYTS